MLVGIEREWANKEFGLRSFAFVSLFGMIDAYLPTPLAAVGFAGVRLLIAIAQFNNFRADRPSELDTSAAGTSKSTLGLALLHDESAGILGRGLDQRDSFPVHAADTAAGKSVKTWQPASRHEEGLRFLSRIDLAG